ncbi:MAG: hypothetical protein Kow0063_28460 [Anaerolineae bacterium]
MYDDRDRPPWLRNLRPARSEPDIEASAPTLVEPIAEPDVPEAPVQAGPGLQGALSRQQMLLLALLLWGNVAILGCLCLLATGTVVP